MYNRQSGYRSVSLAAGFFAALRRFSSTVGYWISFLLHPFLCFGGRNTLADLGDQASQLCPAGILVQIISQ